MRRHLHHASFPFLAWLTTLSFLAALPATASAQAGGAQPNTDVSVIFTALDKDGKAVKDVKAEDVRLSADGVPVQPTSFKNQEDGPVFFTIAIDTSASEEKVLPTTKTIAGLFIKSMMRPGLDKAAVVTFAGDLTVEQAMSGEVDKVLEAVGRARFVPPPGYVGNGIIVGNPPAHGTFDKTGATGMWDAVSQIAGTLMPRSLGAGRRVLLLITDGVDTSSQVKSNKAVAAALESGVIVYAIGIVDASYNDLDKRSLRKIAEQTGGRAFFPQKVGDVTGSFKQISEGLSSQYVITFARAGAGRGDGPFHKLKIEVVNRSLRERGVELTYPQECYAGSAQTTPKK